MSPDSSIISRKQASRVTDLSLDSIDRVSLDRRRVSARRIGILFSSVVKFICEAPTVEGPLHAEKLGPPLPQPDWSQVEALRNQETIDAWLDRSPIRCWSSEAAAARIGVSPTTIRRLRSAGIGPRAIRIASHRVVYRSDELARWLDEQRINRAA